MVLNMKASDLVRNTEKVMRRVGVDLPEDRRPVSVAVDLYKNLGIDVEVSDHQVYVMVGWVMADAVQGALERRTGIRAFNEWLNG